MYDQTERYMQCLPRESTGIVGRVYLVSNPTVQLNTQYLKFPRFTFITINPRIRNVGNQLERANK